tara:strand:+ start:638 stop:1012 length:375 start_codon:yes stop_codon:yes gene_type:complete
MSAINVDTIRSRTGTAPQLDKGVEVVAGYGITGAGGINVSGACTAGGGFIGDINSSSASGISTVGILTAWTSVTVSTGATIESSGAAQFAGIVTASSYYGDGSTLTNAGVTVGKAMGLAAFLGS